MTTFVDVFGVRVPYLLGIDYVSGFVAQRIQYGTEPERPSVRNGDITEKRKIDDEQKRERLRQYTDGFKCVVFLVSTCKTLFGCRPFIGYFQTAVRRELEGFRRLDCIIDPDAPSFVGSVQSVVEIVLRWVSLRQVREVSAYIAMFNLLRVMSDTLPSSHVHRTATEKAKTLPAVLSLKDFLSLRRVVIDTEYGETASLSKIFDVATWPSQVTEFELHQRSIAFPFLFDAVLPVRRLAVFFSREKYHRTSHFKIDTVGIARWPLLEEVVIECLCFRKIVRIAESLACLPTLRTLKIEVCPKRYNSYMCADLRALRSLETIVVHFIFKDGDYEPRIAYEDLDDESSEDEYFEHEELPFTNGWFDLDHMDRDYPHLPEPSMVRDMARNCLNSLLLPSGFGEWTPTNNLPFPSRRFNHPEIGGPGWCWQSTRPFLCLENVR